MRIITQTVAKTLAGLQVTFMFMGAALNARAASDYAIPFRGSLDLAQTIERVEPPTVFVSGEGTGTATHLGQFTSSWSYEINTIPDVAIGSVTFTAANGDTLTAEFTGFGGPTETPNVSLITETLAVTGGTGRFAHASGNITLERRINVLNGLSEGSFDGTLIIPRG